MLLGAGLIWASGANVLEAYRGLFAGMGGSWPALVETGVATTPYILTGLSVALGFHGGLFNIGAEGQLALGALGAAVVGYAVVGLPTWLHMPLAAAAGACGGALWGAIPGLLKARRGAHEVITTIMMNYVAIKLVDYLVQQVLRDPTASLDRTPYVLATAHFPLLFGPNYRLHAGLFVALAAPPTLVRAGGRGTSCGARSSAGRGYAWRLTRGPPCALRPWGPCSSPPVSPSCCVAFWLSVQV